MAARFALFFTCFLVVIYMIQAAEVGAKPEKTGSETVDDTFDKIKSSFTEIVDKVKNNEFVQNATKVFEEFGETIQAKGKDLISKLQNNQNN